jgi:hypothetical protein
MFLFTGESFLQAENNIVAMKIIIEHKKFHLPVRLLIHAPFLNLRTSLFMFLKAINLYIVRF